MYWVEANHLKTDFEYCNNSLIIHKGHRLFNTDRRHLNAYFLKSSTELTQLNVSLFKLTFKFIQRNV